MPRSFIEPKTTPARIAARAAAIAEETRLETLRMAVARWREIVRSIANGQEPDGTTLRDIAIIAERLHLPSDSLAAHVALFAQERRLAGDVAKAQADGKAAEARMEPLGREVQEARERLVALQAEADANILAQQLPVHLVGRLRDLHQQTPVLFGEIGELVSVEDTKAPAARSFK